MTNPFDKKFMSSLAEAENIRQELNNLPIPPDEPEKISHKPSGQEAAKGFSAAMHVVSGVLVGGLIGYGLDIVLNTKPYLMIIFFPIGMLAGFRNMIRTLNTQDNQMNE